MSTRGLAWTPNPLNRSHPFSRGLLAAWGMTKHNAGGRFSYDAVGLNHATLTSFGSGYGWVPTTGPLNYGMKCDGSSSYLDCSPLSSKLTGLSQVTMSAWVLRTSGTICNLGQGTDSGGNSRFGWLWYSDNNIYCQAESSGTAYLSTSLSSYTGWRQIILVFDGTKTLTDKLALYVDGKPVSLSGVGTGLTATVASPGSATWAYGRHINNGSYLYSSTTFGPCHVHGRAFSASDAFAFYEESVRDFPGLLNREPGFRAFLFGSGVSDVAVTISGVNATAAVGSPAFSVGVAFSPTSPESTAQVGAVDISSGVVTTITGVEATAVANDPTSVLVGVTAAPNGAEATSEVGNPTVTVGVAFTVSVPEATAAVGSVGVGGDTVVSTSTVGAMAEVGSVSTVIGVAFTPSAATATAEVGGVSVGGDTTVSVSTIEATAAVGAATASIGVAFSVGGAGATSAVGSVSVVAGVAVSVSGAAAVASVGAVSHAIGVVVSVSGANAVSAVGVVTVTGTAGEDVEVIVVGPEAFAFAGPVGVRTIRFVQPDPWRSTSSPTVAGNEP